MIFHQIEKEINKDTLQQHLPFDKKAKSSLEQRVKIESCFSFWFWINFSIHVLSFNASEVYDIRSILKREEDTLGCLLEVDSHELRSDVLFSRLHSMMMMMMMMRYPLKEARSRKLFYRLRLTVRSLRPKKEDYCKEFDTKPPFISKEFSQNIIYSKTIIHFWVEWIPVCMSIMLLFLHDTMYIKTIIIIIMEFDWLSSHFLLLSESTEKVHWKKYCSATWLTSSLDLPIDDLHSLERFLVGSSFSSIIMRWWSNEWSTHDCLIHMRLLEVFLLYPFFLDPEFHFMDNKTSQCPSKRGCLLS